METLINNIEFAQRLQEIMDTHELSATSFAEKLSVGRATISHLMAGRNKPSLDFVMKVVSVFPEVHLEWLLYGTNSPQKINAPTLQTSSNFTSGIPSQNAQEFTSKTSHSPASNFKENQLKTLATLPSSNSSIKRVIIFLEDGTFESYDVGN